MILVCLALFSGGVEFGKDVDACWRVSPSKLAAMAVQCSRMDNCELIKDKRGTLIFEVEVGQ